MRALLVCVSIVSVVGGCSYDPPPAVHLQQPAGGVFHKGDPLTLAFTEPVKAESLAVRIWSAAPDARTGEGEHVAGLQPTLPSCTPLTSPCGEVELTLAADARSATLHLGGETFTKVKVPWQLEVQAGLSDPSGRETGVPAYFDFEFAPGTEGGGETIAFDSGVYMLVADIADPLPATLRLFSDMHVLSDGRLRFAGAKAVANPTAPKNTAKVSELHVETGDKGFAVFPTGMVTIDGDERFLATEPFNIDIRIGPLSVFLSDVRITGVVRKRPETGHDRIEGTVSFAKITLSSDGADPFEYAASSTSFYADKVEDADVPEDAPRLCGDLCGGVTAQCTPPEDFPGEEFCAAPK